MSNWAALVLSRTYKLDFRLLAVPADFNEQDCRWVEDHLRVTSRSAEDLPDHPRWFIFKNDRHCVVGITCMVRELFDPTRMTIDITQDSCSRPIYARLAYVAKADTQGQFPPLPCYLGQNLTPFQNHLIWMEQCWWAEAFEPLPLYTDYAPLTYTSAPLSSASTDYSLNQEDRFNVHIWPDAEFDRQALWSVAAQAIATNPAQDLSLCLGLSSLRDVKEGPLLNATVTGVNQPQWVAKPRPESAAILKPKPVPSAPVINPKGRKVEQLLGAIIGSTAIGKLTGLAGPVPGIAGVVGGAVVGWIVAGWLDEGSKGAISRSTGDLLDKYLHTEEKPGKRSDRRKVKRSSERSRQPSDSLYGFKEKPKTPPGSGDNNDADWI